MNLAFNAEELAFQKEVRDWITANMPPEVAEESRRSRTSHVSKERLLQWQKKLASRGWLCPNWPKEYGGTGWNSTQKFIFDMEMARLARVAGLGVTWGYHPPDALTAAGARALARDCMELGTAIDLHLDGAGGAE